MVYGSDDKLYAFSEVDLGSNIEPMRNELQRRDADSKGTGKDPPLWYIFKESVRLNPRRVRVMSAADYALQSFILLDGTKLHVGDWVCTLVSVIMQHAEYYREPLQFDGFGFVNPNVINDVMKFKP
ncbi:hypothetical protein CC78DRAFT_581345 [Lojkania enalia]|uniref:Uncharacterized protein n=1 Tax=Lojkania enalia TaxID=147567 RepID=A0A9P4K9C0_9PLEO|nr:hypothetical protein CC78DRAFT_581345 [Didymosphaeria enalia]